MSDSTSLQFVLGSFGLRPGEVSISGLGNAGGMSGASIWQVRAGSTLLCLRRWPAQHPSPERLAWIHNQLRRAAQGGCDFLPLPLSSLRGQTFVVHKGRLWELTPWMPGAADYHASPSPKKLAAALETLARFHQATSAPATDPVAPSPGLQQRWRQIRSVTPSCLSRLAAAIDDRHGAAIERLSRSVLEALPARLRQAAPLVNAACSLRTPLQPCLRDIWHDHVLFVDGRVSALIDFGAMRVDSPAGDVARLMGSLARNDPAQWQSGLSAYLAVRTLTPDQQRMLTAFDAANVPLSGLNWLEWLFIHERVFEELDRVEARLSEICSSLG
jgi:homoserine kinase type II